MTGRETRDPAATSRSGCVTAVLVAGTILHGMGTVVFSQAGSWDVVGVAVLAALVLSAIALRLDGARRLPRALVSGFGIVGYPFGLFTIAAEMAAAAYRGMG